MPLTIAIYRPVGNVNATFGMWAVHAGHRVKLYCPGEYHGNIGRSFLTDMMVHGWEMKHLGGKIKRYKLYIVLVVIIKVGWMIIQWKSSESQIFPTVMRWSSPTLIFSHKIQTLSMSGCVGTCFGTISSVFICCFEINFRYLQESQPSWGPDIKILFGQNNR